MKKAISIPAIGLAVTLGACDSSEDQTHRSVGEINRSFGIEDYDLELGVDSDRVTLLDADGLPVGTVVATRNGDDQRVFEIRARETELRFETWQDGRTVIEQTGAPPNPEGGTYVTEAGREALDILIATQRDVEFGDVDLYAEGAVVPYSEKHCYKVTVNLVCFAGFCISYEVEVCHTPSES